MLNVLLFDFVWCGLMTFWAHLGFSKVSLLSWLKVLVFLRFYILIFNGSGHGSERRGRGEEGEEG